VWCSDAAKYVADVTIPDGAVLRQGSSFNKTWRVMNIGNCAWGPGYELRFIFGDALGAPTSVPVPVAAQGATVDLAVTMFAPAVPGAYEGIWQMANAQGQLFGDRLTVSITVPGAAETRALFWAEPPSINTADCTMLRWETENARAVFLNGTPVIAQGQQQVCLCEATIYTLQVIKQDGQTIEQPLRVEVYGSCATPIWTLPPPARVSVNFWVDDRSIKAGGCTTAHWDVEGVREVYFNGNPTVGHSSQEVCPCESESYVLTVVYLDGSDEDFTVTVDVAGSCKPTGAGEGETPRQPSKPIIVKPHFGIVSPQPKPYHTEEPLW